MEVIVVLLLYLGFIVLMIASLWKVFTKAGQPGWAAIIPIYNLYILTQVARKPGWWVIMFFLPIANIIFAILLGIEVAKNFGKESGFGVGLALLGFIFYPILAFGNAKYIHLQPEMTGGPLDKGM